MIYFIQDDDTGEIKIGTSKRLTVRLKYHESRRKKRLRMLAVTDGGRERERSIHLQFERHRVGNFHLCEWFAPDPELLEFIARVGRPWDGSDEAPAPPKTVHIRLELSYEHQHKLRKFAAEAGMSMAACARAILIQDIESARGRSK